MLTLHVGRTGLFLKAALNASGVVFPQTNVGAADVSDVCAVGGHVIVGALCCTRCPSHADVHDLVQVFWCVAITYVLG